MPEAECETENHRRDPENDHDQEEQQTSGEHAQEGIGTTHRERRADGSWPMAGRADSMGPMYKTIVVGTDGSDTAAIALRHATEVAQAGNATLHIVNVYQPVNPLGMALAGVADDAGLVDAGLADHAREICAPAADAARREGVECEIHAIPGEPSDSLIAVAEQVGADLLVVGNRGMAGVRRVLGSVPNKISHHAPCSVLIVDTR